MSKEIKCIGPTGATGSTALYARVERATDGHIWNSNSAAFEAYSTSSLTSGYYAITMTESGTASKRYTGDFPSGITAPGLYSVLVKQKASAGCLESDTEIAVGNIEWTGSAVNCIANADTNGRLDISKILGTAISTPATAGILDVNVKNINNVVAATPGASGGIIIAGSNAGTTTFNALTVTNSFAMGALTATAFLATNFAVISNFAVGGTTTFTGNVSMAAGLTVTQSSSNSSAITITGNGTGSGISSTGGTTGHGIQAVGGATSGHGIVTTAAANGNGINIGGAGSSKAAMRLVPGSGGASISAEGPVDFTSTFTITGITTFTGNVVASGLWPLDTRIPSALVGGRMDSNMSAIDGSSSAATKQKKAALVIYEGTVTGAATNTTLIDSGLTQSANDFWNGRVIIFLTGALMYQATNIEDFDASTDKLTFAGLTTAPSAADTYIIV